MCIRDRLGWLPKGTHEWEKFITPRELEDMTRKSGLNMVRMTGVSFNPLLNKWQRSGDLGVNYMGVAQRPETVLSLIHISEPTRPY